jgi:hypothetical protein
MSTEPQSIIHHVIRLKQKVVHACNKRTRRTRRMHAATSSVVLFDKSADLTVSTEKTTDPEDCSSLAMELEEYQTIDQNEFMNDYFINGHGSSLFVHFYEEGNSISEAIDKQMEDRATSGQSLCKYMRIEARFAPLITAKLNISAEHPTVVAMKDGELINRLSDFMDEDCGELLNQWTATIELLRMM